MKCIFFRVLIKIINKDKSTVGQKDLRGVASDNKISNECIPEVNLKKYGAQKVATQLSAAENLIEKIAKKWRVPLNIQTFFTFFRNNK